MFCACENRSLNKLPDRMQRRENFCSHIQQTRKANNGAEWKPTEQRFRQNTEKQEINRQCNQDRERVSNHAEGEDKFARQNDQRDNVSGIGRQQDRDEQSFRALEHFLQSVCCWIIAFCPVSQPHRVEGQQTGFNPGEEKRNQPACEKKDQLQGSSPFAPSLLVQTVFSTSNSSIRRRLTRRTVIF